MTGDMTQDGTGAGDERGVSQARAAALGIGAAREAYERYAASAEHALNTVAANAARNRAGLRALALQGFAAADINVRAGFDCVERMARAASVQDALAAQAAFVRDQTQRSLRQAMDLQRAAADLLRAALPGGAGKA